MSTSTDYRARELARRDRLTDRRQARRGKLDTLAAFQAPQTGVQGATGLVQGIRMGMKGKK